jgi:hypothetical protein
MSYTAILNSIRRPSGINAARHYFKPPPHTCGRWVGEESRRRPTAARRSLPDASRRLTLSGTGSRIADLCLGPANHAGLAPACGSAGALRPRNGAPLKASGRRIDVVVAYRSAASILTAMSAVRLRHRPQDARRQRRCYLVPAEHAWRGRQASGLERGNGPYIDHCDFLAAAAPGR